MQQFKVDELKPHPRNNEFFDDITGEKWKEFIKSIQSRGVIEPIVITPNKIIVSGHQRVRACKELGIKTVMCDVHTYDNEDQILQDLLETNLRQRGSVGGSARKVGLRIKELERIYGIKHGANEFQGNQHVEKEKEVSCNNCKTPQTEENLAKKMNMSIRTLQNYKKLTEMIPELSDLVDTGIVTPTTALSLMKQLSNKEQEELISSLDITKKITQNQMQSYIKNIKQPEPEIIDNTDYRIQKKYNDLQTDYNLLEIENETNKRLVESYKTESEEYTKVKRKIIDMGGMPDSQSNLYSASAEIAQLNDEIKQFLDKVSCTRYKNFMFSVKKSDVLRTNLANTLSLVNEWYKDMMNFIGLDTTNNDMEIIDMEER